MPSRPRVCVLQSLTVQLARRQECARGGQRFRGWFAELERDVGQHAKGLWGMSTRLVWAGWLALFG